ncbi:MAG: hypothetical protein ACK2UO_02365 [Caldilineaceae bacterium]
MSSNAPSVEPVADTGTGHVLGNRDSPPLRSLLLALITLVAFALRVLRIQWQPLWWDEGYSVFFATEPLSRMLALTARDIHPPLYYTALHGWITLLHDSGPAALRLFSIAVAVVAIPLVGALASRLSSRNIVAVTGAALLLAVNPLHIYYSQEIRMYSLAASLGIGSSVCLVSWLQRARENSAGGRWLIAYVGLTVFLIGTLYYSAILIAVQFLWAGWIVRRSPGRVWALLAATAVAGLLFVPWSAYALPKLAEYVADKVVADQDASLVLADYVLRHVSAFTAGDTFPFQLSPYIALVIALVALVPLFSVARPVKAGKAPASEYIGLGEAIAFLSLVVGGSLLAGYLINLQFPFFPTGGERLLLFALPYFLTLIAMGGAFSRLSPLVRVLFVVPLVGLSLAGDVGFYTQPRHAEQDYRDIVRSVEERGSTDDTVLALFPWQVGYWRAYGRRDDAGQLVTPQPEAVGQDILVWDDDIRSALDTALEQGVLWFPEPLSLGSDLPQEIEDYLEEGAVNIENRWETAETRLTAWTDAPAGDIRTTSHVTFGPLTLAGYSVTPQSVPGDNSVLTVTLEWDSVHTDLQRQLAVSLVDEDGNVWSERVYTPPSAVSTGVRSFQSDREETDSFQTDTPTQATIDRFGMQAPAGMPPGVYSVRLSVLDASGNSIQARTAESEDTAQSLLLAHIEVTAPPSPVPAIRIPFDFRVGDQPQSTAVDILGVAGIGSDPTVLAGSDMSMKIGLRRDTRDAGNHELSVALTNGEAGANGQVIASWKGWPLPDYPIEAWPQDTILLAPVVLPLPAEMATGAYTLVASVVEESDQLETSPIQLATVHVFSRPLVTEPPAFETPVLPPVQFGTHARLVGYDVTIRGDVLDLLLSWEVMQPLRPQHHIFVHLVDADGARIAQQDGTPVTSAGLAPTGSWRTGEIITTEHHLSLSALDANAAEVQNATLHVGLYDPDTGIRLPTSIDGAQSGDSAIITLSP